MAWNNLEADEKGHWKGKGGSCLYTHLYCRSVNEKKNIWVIYFFRLWQKAVRSLSQFKCGSKFYKLIIKINNSTSLWGKTPFNICDLRDRQAHCHNNIHFLDILNFIWANMEIIEYLVLLVWRVKEKSRGAASLTHVIKVKLNLIMMTTFNKVKLQNQKDMTKNINTCRM